MNIRSAAIFSAGILTLMGAARALSGDAANTLTPEEKAAGWQLLFNGRDLQGWKAAERPEVFKVEHGAIIVTGPRGHLFYDGPVHHHDFKDFELKLEVKTFAGANSGVYFHTQYQDSGWPAKGYEVQVNNSHKDPSRTAGLWGVQENKTPPAADGEWFTLYIRVKGKHIQTQVNGKVIADYTEEPNPPRTEDLKGRLLGSGTIALQAHHQGNEVHYRNIRIRLPWPNG